MVIIWFIYYSFPLTFAFLWIKGNPVNFVINKRLFQSKWKENNYFYTKIIFWQREMSFLLVLLLDSYYEDVSSIDYERVIKFDE